jgi:hypothetical protein
LAEAGAATPTPAPTAAPETAPLVWEQVEPAVWRATAVPLPPAPEPVAETPASPDEEAPPPQLFCHITGETAVSPETLLAALPPTAQPQLFLAPPRNQESLAEAHRWAQERNLALLPAESCDQELLALARDPNTPAVWRITSPQAGDSVSGVLPIVGTADFDPAVVQFYKIELGIPRDNGVEWVTLGEIHEQPVVNGALEMLHADALPPGDYFLRLIVVKDSNYVGEPHTIPITVESS